MLAAACDGARGLVASPEWEQRLGGLRLARVFLQHRVRAAARALHCRSVSCWLQQRQWLQPGMAAPIGPTRPPAPALQVDAAFADDMITTCQHLLEDAEVRVRWAVSAAAAADAADAAHAVSLLTLPADWTAQYVSWAACPQRGRFAHTLLLPSCSLPSPHCCPALRCSIIVLAGGRAAAHAVPAAGHYGVDADAGLPAGVHHPQL